MVNSFTMELIQKRMSIEELRNYLAEIRNRMLLKIDTNPQVTKLNIDDATSYLLLIASPIDKFESMCKSLNIWKF